MSKLDAYLKHAIACERYGNNTKEKVLKLLRLLYKEIEDILRRTTNISSKKKYEEVFKEIKECLTDYKTSTLSILEKAQEIIVDSETSWLSDILADIGSVVIPASLASTVRFSPVSTAVNAEEMVKQSVYKLERQINVALRSTLIAQNDTELVIDALNNSKKAIERQIENDVIAHNETSFKVVDYLMYRANKTKVTYCSILDDRTCIECGEYNGMEFDPKEAPLLPIHNRCRCLLIPTALINDQNLTSYSDWVESLDDKEKLSVLGKTRFQLYKTGIPVTSFVNDGSLIPVAELKDLYED